MDFELSIPEEDGQLRKAFRTKVPGLSARFPALDRTMDVMDLSATDLRSWTRTRGSRRISPLMWSF